MRKDKVIAALEKLKNDLSAEISRLEKLKYPEGCLLIKKERGAERLYLYHKEGKRFTYLTEDKAKKIGIYAQKRYERQLLKNARAELQQMEKCLKILEPKADIEGVYAAMPEVLKPYIAANKKTDKGYEQRWSNEKVYLNKRLKDGEGFPTLRGDRVRSKSEVIIADRLYLAGLSYRYEIFFPMEFEDLDYVYPDFQILNPRTREEFLWEHLGMLDNSEYANKQLKKISGYSRKGYLPGKNLILSFESDERPLDVTYVNAVIEAFFR